MQILVKGKS